MLADVASRIKEFERSQDTLDDLATNVEKAETRLESS